MIKYDNRSWISLIFTLKGSVIKGISVRVVLYAFWSSIVVFFLNSNVVADSIKIDMVVFNVVGLALGLLLVFRTNSSYDRWWEGRKLWGANLTASRNISLILDSVISKNDKSLRKVYSDLIIAINLATKESLRDGVKPEHIQILNYEHSTLACKSTNPSIFLIKLLRKNIEDFSSNNSSKDSRLLQAYLQINSLIDNIGNMERIRYTPIPFAYASHLQLFMLIYFITLPLGLYDKFGWVTVPIMCFTTLMLYGVNEIGVEIEDPFGDDPNDLPLDEICNIIAENVAEILEV